MPNTPKQSFRFLDLPKELRLLVYEFLPNHIARTEYARTLDGGGVSSFVLISTFAPKAIRSTCKLVRTEVESTLRPIAERILHSPMLADPDAQLSGAGPRIETHYLSLDFLATQGGIIEAVTRYFQSLRGSLSDRSVPSCKAEQYLSHDIFSSNGYAMKDGTVEQGRSRALDFVRKAGWALYHLSRNCSLDEFRTLGCTPASNGFYDELRGPMMQIALLQLDADSPSEYYACVTEFSDSIDALESTCGVGFSMHLLNRNNVQETQSKEAWKAIVFAITDLLCSGEMAGGLHGFIKQGVFELDLVDPTAYGKYWCGDDWPERFCELNKPTEVKDAAHR